MREKMTAAGMIIMALVGIGAVVTSLRDSGAALKANSNLQQTTVKIGSQTFVAELALSEAEQAAGLSNRDSLSPGRGMLFVYPQPSSLPFWMKGMKFSIDIVWILRDRVVGVTRNLPLPKIGAPPQQLPTFSPPTAVDYVLEVNAGEAKNIKAGQTVGIVNPEAI